ncbi:hypothetical protein J4443_03645 [Candidatus Woesearchaeota archaeon]|nr:hypothetical protein [Candidatus Woesearchaeota archaeon]
MSLVSKLKTTGKVIAHPLMGVLPEQEWLGKRVSWYNHYYAVASNAVPEILTGLVMSSLNQSEESLMLGLYLGVEGATRLSQLRGDPINLFIGWSKPRGSYVLEVPWGLAKRTSLAIYSLSQDIANYYNGDNRTLKVDKS